MRVGSPAPGVRVGSPTPGVRVGSPTPGVGVGSPTPGVRVGSPTPVMRTRHATRGEMGSPTPGVQNYPPTQRDPVTPFRGTVPPPRRDPPTITPGSYLSLDRYSSTPPQPQSQKPQASGVQHRDPAGVFQHTPQQQQPVRSRPASTPPGEYTGHDSGLPAAEYDIPEDWGQQPEPPPPHSSAFRAYSPHHSHCTLNAPSAQTNVNMRGRGGGGGELLPASPIPQHSSASLPQPQTRYSSHTQHASPRSAGLGTTRGKQATAAAPALSTAGRGVRSPGSARDFSVGPVQWDQRNGSPVSIRVGNQRGGNQADADADATFGSFAPTPTRSSSSLEFPRTGSGDKWTGSDETRARAHASLTPGPFPVRSGGAASFPSEFPPRTDHVEFPRSRDVSTPTHPSPALDLFGQPNVTMATNPDDQLKAMQENMKRMQQYMENQFRTFNLNHPSTLEPPQGFPPLMEPLQIMGAPPPGVGMGEPMIPGVPTPVPNFTSQGYGGTSGAASRGNTATSAYPSNPSSTVTSSRLPPPPPSSNMASLPVAPAPGGASAASTSFRPGMDSMELNRCIQDTPDGRRQLQLKFDMQDFRPEEVSVKKDKNKLEVHAHHEEKEPNRVACKVFHQQYHLPKNVRLAKMEYAMDPEGTLTVKSPVKPRHNVKFEEGQKLEQTKLIQ